MRKFEEKIIILKNIKLEYFSKLNYTEKSTANAAVFKKKINLFKVNLQLLRMLIYYNHL